MGFKQAGGQATVSGTVFNDANGNAVRDEGEAGVPNVSINLYASTSDSCGAKESVNLVSDANGNFRVESLPPGDYLANLYSLPLGSSIVRSSPGGSYGAFAIRESSNQLEIPALVIPGASVRVVAFDDTNHDGTQDGGEAPVAGADFCVVLGYARFAKPGGIANGSAPGCARTGDDGVAFISPLDAGDYVVDFAGTADRSLVNPSATLPSVHLDAGQSVIVPFPLDITTPGRSTPGPAPSTPRQTPSPSFP